MYEKTASYTSFTKGNASSETTVYLFYDTSVTLKEMIRTYAIFANGGKLVTPRLIRRIELMDGRILEEPQVEAKQVLDTNAAFLITTTLRDGVRFGTGVRAQALGRTAAGKTGTTNNYTDAWFIGFVPQLLTGVYMGFDDIQKTLGELETGSRTALPVWLEYMQKAVVNYPIAAFKQPDTIQMVKVVPESGMLDCEGNRKGYFEYFSPGTAPASCHEQDVESRPRADDRGDSRSVDDEAYEEL